MRPLLRASVVREAGAYAAASAAAFAIDFLLLAFQVSILRVPYLAAAAVSFLAGTLFIYWACVRHIFGYRRIEEVHHELAIFAAIGALGLVVNLGAMYLAVDTLGLHYLTAKVCAAGATFALNFALRRFMLFTSWQDHMAPRSPDRFPPA